MDESPQSLAAAITGACDAVSHNLAGQRLGKKGRVTRERILAATIELLETTDVESITLTAVAKKASLAMSSVYNYFNDLTELVLAVLELVMAMAEEEYLKLLDEYWPDKRLHEKCLEFITAYNQFWSKHAKLFHLRNRMADELDTRVMQHRLDSGRPVLRRLEFQLAPEPVYMPSEDISSMASVLLTGIERTATVATNPHYAKLNVGGFTGQQVRLVEPEARLLELAIKDTRERERSKLAIRN